MSEQDGGSSLLPEYTAAAAAEQRLGPAFYTHEMALRRTLATLTRSTAASNQTLSNVMYLGQGLYLDQGPLARHVQALGLLGRVGQNGIAVGPSPALDGLRHAIGPARLRRLLIALSWEGATSNDDASAACALYHRTGQPVTAWANRYLPSASAIKPAGGCR